MKLKNNSIIYILCPPNYATGGTELLHQLSDALLTHKRDARIFYWPQVKDPTSAEFKKYKLVVADKIEDRENNVFIAPEIDNYKIFEFHKIQKVIWWLSVDNHFKNRDLIRSNLKLRILKVLLNRKYFDIDSDRFNSVTHFAQSYYAMNFLKSKRVEKHFLLSDYINDKFLNGSEDVRNKENIVLYNPKKGISFTKKLMALSSDKLKWVALENLTRDEVFHLLQKAKVYVDFGNHPGKDRFPREAAISGCCVITNKEGSAGNEEDLPIPNNYKFTNSEKNIDDILETIENCISEYERRIIDFQDYRNKITKEKEIFFEEVKSLFKFN